jgi:hypothetical protein
MGINGVGQMALKDGKVDINGIPQVLISYGLDGSATVDETLGPNML